MPEIIVESEGVTYRLTPEADAAEKIPGRVVSAVRAASQTALQWGMEVPAFGYVRDQGEYCAIHGSSSNREVDSRAFLAMEHGLIVCSDRLLPVDASETGASTVLIHEMVHANTMRIDASKNVEGIGFCTTARGYRKPFAPCPSGLYVCRPEVGRPYEDVDETPGLEDTEQLTELLALIISQERLLVGFTGNELDSSRDFTVDNDYLRGLLTEGLIKKIIAAFKGGDRRGVLGLFNAWAQKTGNDRVLRRDIANAVSRKDFRVKGFPSRIALR